MVDRSINLKTAPHKNKTPGTNKTLEPGGTIAIRDSEGLKLRRP